MNLTFTPFSPTRTSIIMQQDLFPPNPTLRRTQLGHSSIHYKQANSILSAATGFMNGYDFTLDRNTGCCISCSYCYAAFSAGDNA
ncbi:hypothetical protein GCM10027511_22050 [Hymenobacter humi]